MTARSWLQVVKATSRISVLPPRSTIRQPAHSVPRAAWRWAAGGTHTLLPDGSVLFAGGNTDFTTGDATDSVERYDPASGTFTTLGTLDVVRVNHTASPLPDGTLLIVGGGSATPERWDPETDGFEPGGTPVLGSRSEHSATVLPDSRVFIAGGSAPGSATELYVPDGIIVEGGSAAVPDFATLGTSVTEVFAATAGDISLATDLYTFTAAASSLPFPSPSVSVSLTPLADLAAFAAAAPLPDGASFLGAVALDVFVSGLASGPFSGPATIASVVPAGVAPGEIVAYGFIPLLITSQTSGHPAPNWARLTLAGLEGDDTFNVSGPGIIAFGLGRDPVHAGIPGLNGGVVIVFDPVEPGTPFTVTDVSGAYRIHGPADLFAGEQPDTVVARLTVHGTGPGFAGPDGRAPIELVELSIQSVRPVDLGVTGEFYLDDFQSFRTLSVSEGTVPEIGSSQLGGGLNWTMLDPSVVEIDEVVGSVRFPMGGGGLFAIVDLDVDAAAPLTLATTASANFVLWTAGETSASEVFSGDTVRVVWRWNGEVWESFNPNVPPILSTDFALGVGPGPDVLWLVTSGPLTVDAPAGGSPAPAGPNLTLATEASADFVVWRGGETTAAALFGAVETVVIVWRWTGETWVAFNPALPPALQTDFALGAGDKPDLLWLVTTGPVEVPLNP
jgi:hypothetical protein